MGSHRITFCFVVHSLSYGGMERVTAELTKLFSSKAGIDIHLILYGHKREIFYSIPQSVRIHKPEFEFRNDFRKISSIRTMVYVRKKIKEIRPDVVLSFGEFWNNFILIALLGLDVKIYISDRSSPLKSLGRVQSFLRKILYPKAAGLIVQTKQAETVAVNGCRNRNTRVIGNPIRSITPCPSVKKGNIVLTVGRIIPSKNLDRLIRIFVGLRMPDWKLVIVGDDPMGQKNMMSLKKLVKDLNAEESVLFVGFQKDIDAFYLRSKIFAFTSNSEGFPNALGEALSSGLPAVSYDCVSGPAEMIEDGKNGFLVPVFSDSIFGEKLRLLMENEVLRIGMSEKAIHSMEKFNAEAIGEEYFEFLTESLSVKQA